MLNRAVEVATEVQHVGQVVLRARHLGIEPNRFLIFGHRAVEIAIVLHRKSQIVVRIRIVWFYSNRRFQFRNCFGIALMIEIEPAQVIVRFKIIGINLDCRLIFGDGIFRVALALECYSLAEVVLGVHRNGVLRFCRRGLPRCCLRWRCLRRSGRLRLWCRRCGKRRGLLLHAGSRLRLRCVLSAAQWAIG